MVLLLLRLLLLPSALHLTTDQVIEAAQTLNKEIL